MVSAMTERFARAIAELRRGFLEPALGDVATVNGWVPFFDDLRMTAQLRRTTARGAARMEPQLARRTAKGRSSA